jgi:hypothetical protein
MSGDIETIKGANGGYVDYIVVGDGNNTRVELVSLNGDDKISQADLDRFRQNHPDLYQCLDAVDAKVPLLWNREETDIERRNVVI